MSNVQTKIPIRNIHKHFKQALKERGLNFSHKLTKLPDGWDDVLETYVEWESKRTIPGLDGNISYESR